MRAGCSIRLSTPPSDSASRKSFVRATSATASSSDSARNETMPPKSRIWRSATSWPGCDAQAGVEHALDRRVPVEEGRDRARVLAVLAHADGERLDPAQHEPRVERAGHGAERLLQEAQPLARARRRSWRRSRRSRRSGRRGTSSSSGRRRRRRARAAAGGTASRTCCRRRGSRRPRAPRRPRARMSTTFSSGFDGDSTQTIATSSSRWSARFSSNSSAGT